MNKEIRWFLSITTHRYGCLETFKSGVFDSSLTPQIYTDIHQKMAPTLLVQHWATGSYFQAGALERRVERTVSSFLFEWPTKQKKNDQ